MPDVTSLSAVRIPAAEVQLGDRLVVIGKMYFTVEWKRIGPRGDIFLAGLRSNGEPHTSSMSPAAMVNRVFKVTCETGLD
jgi:hypothetical protein